MARGVGGGGGGGTEGGGGGGSPANPLFEPAAPLRPPPAGDGGKKKPKRPNRRLRQGGAYAVAVAAPPKPKPKKKPAPPQAPPPRALGAADAAARSPLRTRAVPSPAGGESEEKNAWPGAEAGVGAGEEREPRLESSSAEARVGGRAPGGGRGLQAVALSSPRPGRPRRRHGPCPGALAWASSRIPSPVRLAWLACCPLGSEGRRGRSRTRTRRRV